MKKVLITGANSGFGYLTALTFARNGYKVYATARDLTKDGVKEMNEIVLKENLQLEWLVLDVTNDTQIEEAFKKIESLDILVNNAGYGMVGFVESFTPEDLITQLDTNLVGSHRMIKSALPLLKESKGRIINVASIAGKVTYPRYGVYSASKFAVEGYSEALRVEMNMIGIQVAVIEPGTFNTGFGSRIVNGKENTEKYDNGDPNDDLPPIFKLLLGMFRQKTNPQKVADRIFKIANMSRMPFHNYVGKDAKLIIFFRKLLPEKFWDWLVISLFK